MRYCVTPPWYPRLIVRQMISIGYFSLPVVGLTAFFTGPVVALKIYVGGSRFNAESAVATMLHKGKFVWNGPVADIDKPGSDFVDQFIKGRAEGPIEMEVLAL